MSDCPPTLLAVSDVLILTALERAWARTVKRAQRSCPAHQRHNQYLTSPVREDRMEAVLHDAWTLCPLLTHRHDLPVDPVAWADTLDGYTRALLLMAQPHNPTRLAPILGALTTTSDNADWEADTWDGDRADQ